MRLQQVFVISLLLTLVLAARAMAADGQELNMLTSSAVANWASAFFALVSTAVMSVMAYLMKRGLDQIDQRLDTHSEKIDELSTAVAHMQGAKSEEARWRKRP